MWYLAYNIGLLLASPVILAMLLAKKRCWRGLPQRLGRIAREATDRPVIWVHAVSLGEVVAAVPLVRQLHDRHPDSRIVVTTVTETGREAVEQRLAGIAEHRYAPLDFPWAVRAFIRALDPRLFIFVETELWPNLLRTLARCGVPVVLVNGRLSSRSFRGYRLARPFMRQILGGVSALLMQSARDAARIVALGAPPDRTQCTGNIKFDQPMAAALPVTLTKEVLLHDGEDLLVAGSTHPGEEEAWLRIYSILLTEFPSLVLLLAPRHIERADKLEAVVAGQGFRVMRRSRIAESAKVGPGPRVMILDTRGELAGVYRYAVVTFVGGTLVPVGGHNLLEPAAWGKPVFFGPHTDHCAEIATLLQEAGGGRQIGDAESGAIAVAAVLRDRDVLHRMGEAARRVVAQNRGALDRTLDALEKVIAGQCPNRSIGRQTMTVMQG